MAVSDKLFTHLPLKVDFSAPIAGGVPSGDPGEIFARADAVPNVGDTSFIDNTGLVVFVGADVARFHSRGASCRDSDRARSRAGRAGTGP